MKNILALSKHVNKWGAERSMCVALDALNHHGYKVLMIITSHGDIEELLKMYHIDYIVCPLDSFISNYKPTFYHWVKIVIRGIYYNFKHNRAIIRELQKRDFTPDYIYTNTIIPFNGFVLSCHYHCRHILHIREYVQEDFHFNYILGEKFYLNIVYKNVDKVICISEGIYDKFKKFFGSKAIRIYNGVSINKENKGVRLITDDILSIVFVGRLSEEKGIVEFVNILKDFINKGFKKVHLDVWGNGCQRDLLNSIIDKDKLIDFVTLRGYGENLDLSVYDLGVMSSKCEGFGRTTVEYMLSGLAVLGYNGGATPEIVKDKETGFLYWDKESAIKALQLIYEMKTADTLATLGEAGRKRAQLMFSQDTYIKNMINLFDSISTVK